MAISIYRTEDGGVTWTQTYTNDPNLADASDSLPLGGIKSNLTPLDSQTAWVGGVIYAPETFYFYKTVDGGQSWVQQDLPAAPNMQNTDVSIENGPIFTSSNEGILPIRFSGDTMRTGFYTTHDAGESWEFVTFIPGAGEVDFVSPSDGFHGGVLPPPRARHPTQLRQRQCHRSGAAPSRSGLSSPDLST